MVEKNFLQKFLKCTSIKLLKWTSTPMGNNEFSSSTSPPSPSVVLGEFWKKDLKKNYLVNVLSWNWFWENDSQSL